MSKLRNIGLIALGVVAGILVSLNFQAIAERAARSPLPVEELRAFTEVFGAIKQNYVEPVEDKKLINEAINGMLAGLDPHSAYLDAEAFRELQVGTQGQFGGLGIEVGMEDGFVKVVSPIEDTPAFRAGIKPGDLIIRLDDTPVKGMTLNDAVKRMRGKPNTQITLTIVAQGRAGADRRDAHARGDPRAEREVEDDRAGLRLGARVAVPGVHHREPGEARREPVQAGPAEGPGAGSAQRPGRPALRRGGHLLGVPARQGAGGVHRRPHRGREARSSTPAPRTTCAARATTC